MEQRLSPVPAASNEREFVEVREVLQAVVGRIARSHPFRVPAKIVLTVRCSPESWEGEVHVEESERPANPGPPSFRVDTARSYLKHVREKIAGEKSGDPWYAMTACQILASAIEQLCDVIEDFRK